MIFLTGASGLVGSAVARQLVAKGEPVLAHRRPTALTHDLGDWTTQVHWTEGSLLDPIYLDEQLARCQLVIHCAGLVSFDPKDKDELYRANTLVTESLINAALRAQVQKFVHLSSVAAIGRPRHKTVIDERQQWEDSDLNSYYAQTKHWAELEVWRGIAEGLPAVILNPSVIIGHHPRQRSSSQLLYFPARNTKYYPPGKLNWVALPNVVTAVEKVLSTKEFTSQRYIISAGALSYQQFFTRLAKLVGKRPPYVEAKIYTLTAAYYLQQVAGLFGKKEKLISKETLNLSKTSLEFNNSKSLQDLDMKYTGIDEALKLAVSAPSYTLTQ